MREGPSSQRCRRVAPRTWRPWSIRPLMSLGDVLVCTVMTVVSLMGFSPSEGVFACPVRCSNGRSPGQKPGAGPWSRPPATDNNRLRPRDRLPAVDDDVAVRGEHDLVFADVVVGERGDDLLLDGGLIHGGSVLSGDDGCADGAPGDVPRLVEMRGSGGEALAGAGEVLFAVAAQGPAQVGHDAVVAAVDGVVAGGVHRESQRCTPDAEAFPRREGHGSDEYGLGGGEGRDVPGACGAAVLAGLA